MGPDGDNFSRQSRRGTNGRIVQIEGIPRRPTTAASSPQNVTPATTVNRSPSPSQCQPQQLDREQQVPSNSPVRGSSFCQSNLGAGLNTNKPECKIFDDIISRVGSNGAFQKRLLRCIISPFCVIQPILAFNAVFMLYIPEHWCSSPDYKDWDDKEEYKLVNIPLENGTDGLMKYSNCKMYGHSRSEISCPYGWEYDKGYYEKTMSSEYNWVCDNASTSTWVLTAGAIGNAFGTLFFGMFSDNFGRKPTLFLALTVNIVFRIFSLFVGSRWYLQLVAQFFTGSTTTSLFVVPALIAAELCDKDDRGEVYAVTWTICLFGYVILPGIAWISGNWFFIGLITVGIGCIMYAFYPVIPESPRWLVQKGRVNEAAAVLQQVQDYNNSKKKNEGISQQDDQVRERRRSCMSNKENNLDYLKSLVRQVLEKQRNAEERLSVAEGRGAKLEDRSKATVLFGKKNLAKNTLMLTICWSMNTLIYSTMTYNSTHMSGNHFINFFLLGIIEVPSGFFGGYLADTLGRRWTQAGSFGLCALTCFATSIMVHQRELEVLLATLSKLVVTVSFLVVYCQATELFPTELRSTGSGIASTIGNVVCIGAPLISDLSAYSAAYPWLTMGFCSIVGMIAAAFLPETLNIRLPETIEEANNIGKNRKFWNIITPEMERSRRKNKERKKMKNVDSE